MWYKLIFTFSILMLFLFVVVFFISMFELILSFFPSLIEFLF